MTSSPLFPNVIPAQGEEPLLLATLHPCSRRSSLISNMTEKKENEAEELIDVMKHV
jgi:hypothetical protein